MRYFLITITVIALFVAIVLATLSGFLSLGILNEVRSICPDDFQCSDAQLSLWIYLPVFAFTSLLAVLLFVALKRLARVSTADPKVMLPPR